MILVLGVLMLLDRLRTKRLDGNDGNIIDAL